MSPAACGKHQTCRSVHSSTFGSGIPPSDPSFICRAPDIDRRTATNILQPDRYTMGVTLAVPAATVVAAVAVRMAPVTAEALVVAVVPVGALQVADFQEEVDEVALP